MPVYDVYLEKQGWGTAIKNFSPFQDLLKVRLGLLFAFFLGENLWSLSCQQALISNVHF